MKKLLVPIFTISVIITVFLVLYIQKKPEQISNIPSPDSKITPTVNLTPVFAPPKELNSKDNKIQWIIVRDLKKITLLSNLEEKLTSREALSANGCLYLVTGGFWKEENKHIGLLVIEKNVENEAISDDLLNGFFYITKSDIAAISRVLPAVPSLRLGLQSGPMLLQNGKPLNLSLIRDENARRIVVATTPTGDVIFLVVYYQASPLLGPKLAELPEILDDIQKNTSLEFDSALNLDGGTHSAYLTDAITLTEVSRFGSFFCIKP